MSNLPLQMSLYFNAFFFPCWWIVLVVMLEAKVNLLNQLTSAVNMIILARLRITVSLLHCCRIRQFNMTCHERVFYILTVLF